MLFLDQLEELGWLDPDMFETDSSLLELAIGRYHQYLDVGILTLRLFSTRPADGHRATSPAHGCRDEYEECHDTHYRH